MISDLQRQFIEASARVLWQRDVERLGACPTCAAAGRTAEQCAAQYTSSNLDLPREHRDQAAMFLGALQQANGCELEEIVRQANRACIGRECGADAIAAIPDHDIREFARIITLQALGEPVRWGVRGIAWGYANASSSLCNAIDALRDARLVAESEETAEVKKK